MLDGYGRSINYVRLAVTDRCNLRCTYCMPKEGFDWHSRDELMTYEEMLRLSSLLVSIGVQKIRITGGEPFIRQKMGGKQKRTGQKKCQFMNPWRPLAVEVLYSK